MSFNPGPEEFCRQVMMAVSLPRLAALAMERSGFRNSDVGCGVTYPHELDAGDLAEGHFIPEGFVELYLGWGPPAGFEMQVPESLYRSVAAERLDEAGFRNEAAILRDSRR